LNRARQISLVLPAFCLAEAYAQLNRRTAERNRLFRGVQDQTRELSRSLPQQAFSRDLSNLANNLKTVNESQAAGLGGVVAIMLEEAVLLQMTISSHRAARALISRAVLEPQAANVYSTIVEDLCKQTREVPKLFLSRDKAFSSPTITTELKDFGCQYVHSFDAGRARILAQLNGPGAGGSQ
jgi:hypothetical protein